MRKIFFFNARSEYLLLIVESINTVAYKLTVFIFLSVYG